MEILTTFLAEECSQKMERFGGTMPDRIFVFRSYMVIPEPHPILIFTFFAAAPWATCARRSSRQWSGGPLMQLLASNGGEKVLLSPLLQF